MDDKNNSVKNRYDRIAPVYDKFEYIMERLAFIKWRKYLWELIAESAQAGDELLEVGVGTGKNIPYYPEKMNIVAIDFSPGMLTRAREKADRNDRKVRLKEEDVQELTFPDDSFDFIVTSCVFCSVPDPVLGFKELNRVIKSDGELYLLEHVRSKKFLLGPLMDLTNFIPKYIWGANINRHTLNNIRQAGLEIKSVENLWLDIFKLIIAQKGQ